MTTEEPLQQNVVNVNYSRTRGKPQVKGSAKNPLQVKVIDVVIWVECDPRLFVCIRRGSAEAISTPPFQISEEVGGECGKQIRTSFGFCVTFAPSADASTIDFACAIDSQLQGIVCTGLLWVEDLEYRDWAGSVDLCTNSGRHIGKLSVEVCFDVETIMATAGMRQHIEKLNVLLLQQQTGRREDWAEFRARENSIKTEVQGRLASSLAIERKRRVDAEARLNSGEAGGGSSTTEFEEVKATLECAMKEQEHLVYSAFHAEEKCRKLEQAQQATIGYLTAQSNQKHLVVSAEQNDLKYRLDRAVQDGARLMRQEWLAEQQCRVLRQELREAVAPVKTQSVCHRCGGERKCRICGGVPTPTGRSSPMRARFGVSGSPEFPMSGLRIAAPHSRSGTQGTPFEQQSGILVNPAEPVEPVALIANDVRSAAAGRSRNVHFVPDGLENKDAALAELRDTRQVRLDFMNGLPS